MKANEFVKENGWEKAKEALNRVAWCEGSYCTKLNHGCIKNNHECCVDVDDLKHLVESRELVGMCGGLEMAKSDLNYLADNGLQSFEHSLIDDLVIEVAQLKQAIADVESCQ